jgi:Leucine-rich repeat (LRR) protein
MNDGFEYIPASFSELKNLKRLDLIGDSNLNLEQAFEVISELPSLTQLRLENFASIAISDELVFPTQIETLSLRNNHLQKIPMGVTKIPRLQLLDIGENDISDQSILSTNLATLRNLRVLFLDHESNLTANGLFPLLNTLPSLEIVHLEESMIQEVNSEFKERSLQELILDPNLLNTSPTYLPNSRYVVPNTPQTVGSGTIQIPLSK